MTDRHAKTSATRTARIRAQITIASKPLFDARSPYDLTFDEVAKEARLTPQTVQKHFPNLSNLAVEAYLRPINEMCQRLLQEKEHTTRSRLTQLIIELATLFVQHPSLAVALTDELQRDVNDQHAMCRSLLSGTERWFNSFRRCEKEASRERAVSLITALARWTSTHFKRHETPDADLIEARAHRTVTDLSW